MAMRCYESESSFDFLPNNVTVRNILNLDSHGSAAISLFIIICQSNHCRDLLAPIMSMLILHRSHRPPPEFMIPSLSGFTAGWSV
jgi:hypothetical protein